MISIIILSSDGYSDCWDTLFLLFKKNFPEISNYEIILSTNNKQYTDSDLNIKLLLNGDVSWSKRLKLSLEEASYDIAMVLVEDFWLSARLDFNLFEKLLKYFDTVKEIDHIRLLTSPKRTAVKKSKYVFLDEIEMKTKLRFAYLPGLWRKNVLLKYVKDFETPFMSERIGDYRSYIYKDGFYCISQDYINNNGQLYKCSTSGALFKGKWNEWVENFTKKEHINIDFSKRGFVTDEHRKNTRINSKKAELRKPIPIFKSFISLVFLYIQSFFVKS